MPVINFEVLEEASVVYELVTYEGEIKVNGESLRYRYSEDDNGVDFFIYLENGWESVDYDSNESYGAIFHAIQMYGNPKEFGKTGDQFEEDSANLL